MKTHTIRRHLTTVVVVISFLTLWIFCTLYVYETFISPTQKLTPITPAEFELQSSRISNVAIAPAQQSAKRLIFYNKPPKTGSTTIRVAMNRVLREKGMTPAKCFTTILWNEAGYRTIINRRNVDFWGCHVRLTKDRTESITNLRNGNVTFITGTRDPKKLILSSYLQENRDRDVAGITDPAEMEEEVKRYKIAAEKYPIDALYAYHGATEPLTACPAEWRHELSMHEVAARYEAVIDLERPHESAKMVELVTGLKPNFDVKFNERTSKVTPMLEKLEAVDMSHRTCGNELVHKVLMQQFNVIKDRLMQNMCFDEDTGSFELCDKANLDSDDVKERNRKEQYEAKRQLQKA